MIRSAIRSPMRPARTTPLQYRPRTASSPYAAFNSFVQSLYTGGETGIWYDGTDNSQRAVNSDGSGGAPAIGAKFGWLNDKSGGGRPAIQATAGSQPIAQSNYVLFQHQDAITVGDPRRFLAPASATGASMQNAAGVIICDVQLTPFGMMPVTGWYYSGANTAYPCRYGFVAWRTNNSGFVDLYVCGVNYGSTPSGAVPAIAQRAPTIGISSDLAGKQMLFYQYAHFNSRLSDANWNQLRAAAAAACGAANFGNDGWNCVGDSNTEGFRVTNGQTWPWILAGMIPSVKVFNTGISAVPMANVAANINGSYVDVYGCPGNNFLSVLNATNDVGPSTYIDYSRLYGSCFLRGRQQNVRSIGVCYMPTSTSVQSFNNELRNNQPGEWFDTVVDLESVPQLANTGNTTYYQTDLLHLKDAALPFVAAAMYAGYQAIATKPYAKFTASPINGTAVNATFTNASSGATSYAWDFDNNGSTDSTATNPTNNYTVAGNYAPKLTATNANGSSPRVRQFYINVLGTLTPVTSGLVFRFMQNTGITDVANAVSAWADQSGNGNNLVQATGANQPTKQGDGTISFDGVNDFMAMASFGLDYKLNVMARMMVNTFTSGRVICDGLVNNAQFTALNASPRLSIFQVTGSIAVQTLGVPTGSYFSLYTGTTDLSGVPRMQVLQLSGEDALMGSWGGFANAGGLTLGARYDGSNPCAARFKEVLGYNRGLTPAEKMQNFAYLDSL